MKSISLRTENIIYTLIFTQVLVLRFIGLGALPFSDAEAGLALNAAGRVVPGGDLLTSQPGYTAITAMLFKGLGSSDFLARLVPAIAGSALVLIPLFIRRWIGRGTALMMAFLLAVDPAGVAFSRQAGGSLLAVSSLAYFILALLMGRRRLAAVCLGLALTGGYLAFVGLLVLMVVVIWGRKPDGLHGEENPLAWLKHFAVKEAVFITGGVTILVCTLFFLQPANLAALGGSLLDVFRAKGVGGVDFWLLLLVYYLPIFLLGVWQGVLGILHKARVETWLVRVVFVVLIWSIFSPWRSSADLLLFSLPLTLLAGRRIAAMLDVDPMDGLVTYGQAVAVITLGGYIWLNLHGVAQSLDVGDVGGKWLAILTAIGLMIVLTILVGMGWSWQQSRKAFLAGLTVLLLVSSTGTAFRAAGLTGQPCAELLRPSSCYAQAEPLQHTIRDVSEWNLRSRTGIDIRVEPNSSNALAWTLREFPNVSMAATHFETEKPSIIITPSGFEKLVDQGYVGQTLEWSEEVPWQSLSIEQWLRWVILREVDPGGQTLVVWVRNDLFPGVLK